MVILKKGLVIEVLNIKDSTADQILTQLIFAVLLDPYIVPSV